VLGEREEQPLTDLEGKGLTLLEEEIALLVSKLNEGGLDMLVRAEVQGE
jgi:hypothetical protein